MGSGWVKFNFMKFGLAGLMVSSKGIGGATTPVSGSRPVTICSLNIIGPPNLFITQKPFATTRPVSLRGAASMYAIATISGTFIMKRVVVTVSVNGRFSSSSAMTVRGKLSSTAFSMRC